MASMSEFIEQHYNHIVDSWVEKANKAASARGLTRPQLTNIMPEYLRALAHSAPGQQLSSGDGRSRELIESHLGSRLRLGFHLAEIVEEFVLLGRCISATWSQLPLADQPAPLEVERLYQELHLATLLVMEHFQEHMQKDEQAEKRYLRLLRTLSHESLHAPGPPLDARLREIMTLVMEAMGAQTAALFLHEPRNNNLLLAASVGLASEEMTRSLLGGSSFVNRVAESAEPTSFSDVETTELQVSEALRHSGIHGILGVRLPPHFRLVGVMCVGVTEARPFTAREIRRLVSLGEPLTLHLDNVRLYEELSQRAEALRIERDFREQIVSVLVHELRGPLSSVRAGAQLLYRHTEMHEAQRAWMRKIDRNITRMDEMIRDLLDVHRLHVGQRLPLRLAPCDLGALANDVAEELRRALWNLATNAVKYGAAGRAITLTVQRSTEGARVSVHNEGPEISAEDRAHLFEPFSRARRAQASGREGWGLGLFLVRGCAEAHGGRVWVKSDETGTTFTLELPWDARPYQGTDAPLAAGMGATATPSSH